MGKMSIGIIGCGVISEIYLKNLTTIFADYISVVACADRFPEVAKLRAEQFGVAMLSVEELLADPAIEMVINLTAPDGHYEINKRALFSGKHVYCEKPLALTVAEGRELLDIAREERLYIAAAPDTFLGAGLQTGRAIIDSGEIGEPVGAYGFLLSRGPESFHPNPSFFYQQGAGPLFDMGPYYFTALTALLGPAVRIGAMARCHTPVRRVQNQNSALYDTAFVSQVDTFVNATVEFKNGCIANVTTGWEMPFPYWEAGLPQLIIYGTKGSLVLPDPNSFGGIAPSPFGEEPGRYLILKKGTEKPYELPVKTGFLQNSRGLGAVDMAMAIKERRPSGVSAEMALHVLEMMSGTLEAATENKYYQMTTTCKKPVYLNELLLKSCED
ncbi:MAG: Gfo/Idh/MocA family oxidoreductase [Lachnospiraceae bacterium]|jgi:predicted dehydrogenase|nr:Gfo/Idh/MocA family oxidoreductase [Lachnospiraceae bacterium]